MNKNILIIFILIFILSSILFGRVPIDIKKVLIKKNLNEIKKLVDAERMQRDADRLVLNDDFYDVIIYNDGSIEDLRNEIKRKMFAEK